MSTFDLFDRAVRLGLDGIHLDDGVLETLERPFLEEVAAAARERGLYLEYNFSMDMAGAGIGIQHDLMEALDTAAALSADVVKVGLDMRRPRPVAASRFHPEVRERLLTAAGRLKAAAPRAAALGIRIGVEKPLRQPLPTRFSGCWTKWAARRWGPAWTRPTPWG